MRVPKYNDVRLDMFESLTQRCPKPVRIDDVLHEKFFAAECRHRRLVKRHVSVGVTQHGGRRRNAFHVEHELVRANVPGVDDGIDTDQRLGDVQWPIAMIV